jgi:tetratricopeptide (TPR) repeat protein
LGNRGFLPGWATGLLGVLLLAASAPADTIVLTNGRVIEADRAWVEGTQVRYEKDGGVYGLPRSLVKQLDQRAAPLPATDPDVRAARALLAEDAAEAARLARRAVDRDPGSLPALQTLSEALLALGDARGARDRAVQALRIDEREPRSRTLYGDALLALGDRLGAEEAYRLSLRLRPDPAVERKLKSVASPLIPQALPDPSLPAARISVPLASASAFRLRYEGGANEGLGAFALKTLAAAHAEYAARLGFSPDQPVDVTLQLAKAVQDPRAPAWAAGWSADGAIQVSAQGLERPDANFARVLRHELAHSFVTWRTGNNCPTWLQEGVALWLEGGDPARNDAGLAALARASQLPSLVSLEGPFHALPEAEAQVAYAASLSAVAHIARKRGEAGVVRLVSALGDKLPSEEALPVALALSYPELQQSWTEHLRGADGATAGKAGRGSVRGD